MPFLDLRSVFNLTKLSNEWTLFYFDLEKQNSSLPIVFYLPWKKGNGENAQIWQGQKSLES